MPKLNRQFVIVRWLDANGELTIVANGRERVTVVDDGRIPASRRYAEQEIQQMRELWDRTYGTWTR